MRPVLWPTGAPSEVRPVDWVERGRPRIQPAGPLQHIYSSANAVQAPTAPLGSVSITTRCWVEGGFQGWPVDVNPGGREVGQASDVVTVEVCKHDVAYVLR